MSLVEYKYLLLPVSFEITTAKTFKKLFAYFNPFLSRHVSYMFKADNRKSRSRREICLKLSKIEIVKNEAPQ